MTPATARPIRSLKFPTARLFALSTCLLSVSYQASAEEHTVLCGCCMFSQTIANTDEGSNVDTFRLNNRWTTTASGSAGDQGDAITLTWGIVDDGTPITRAFTGESSDDSNLIARLDSIYGSGPGGSNLTLRPWFDEFADSYNRWSQISGLTFIYEANDNGTNLRSGSSGSLGVQPDMRIGGHGIDGNSGTLAYNYYPDSGDMVIDTADNYYNTITNDSRRLRNILMHEVGHG